MLSKTAAAGGVGAYRQEASWHHRSFGRKMDCLIFSDALSGRPQGFPHSGAAALALYWQRFGLVLPPHAAEGREAGLSSVLSAVLHFLPENLHGQPAVERSGPCQPHSGRSSSFVFCRPRGRVVAVHEVVEQGARRGAATGAGHDVIEQGAACQGGGGAEGTFIEPSERRSFRVTGG